MSEQTEKYIVLKPIAERFNNVAKTITDDDIKHIIKDAMREQIKGVFDFSLLSEMTGALIESKQDEFNDMIYNSIAKRLEHSR